MLHAGRLLALWWLGGPCYQVALPTRETVGEHDFGGSLPEGLTAHPKLDPETGELMVFDYDVLSPYLSYRVVSAAGRVVHRTDIDDGGLVPHIDVLRLDDGPVARVEIPQRVPIGYHTRWVGAAELDDQQLTP